MPFITVGSGARSASSAHSRSPLRACQIINLSDPSMLLDNAAAYGIGMSGTVPATRYTMIEVTAVP